MRTVLVQRVVAHAPDLKSFYVPRTFDVSPGQFVLVWLHGVDEKPFSISSVDDNSLEITIKSVGPFTRAMMDVGAGQRIGLRGPFGRGFRPAGPAVIVGGGCGVAPVRYLAQEMARTGLEFELLLGTRTASELMFRDEYRRAGPGSSPRTGPWAPEASSRIACGSCWRRDAMSTSSPRGPRGCSWRSGTSPTSTSSTTSSPSSAT